MNLTYTLLKKTMVGLVGCTLLLLGFILLFIPGPGIPILILGLLLLSSEFLWAHHLVVKYKLRKPEALLKKEEKIVKREVIKEEKEIVKKIKKGF